MYSIPYAPIYWQDDTPGHLDYQDHYFSRHDGLQESRYIFLSCNGLPERWQSVRHFVIAETGFGTGLNFLASLDLWRRQGPADGTLHFLSLDRSLVHPSDLQRILARWPELADLGQSLLQAWPEPVSGLHRREFLDGRVVLTLGLGEALEVLRQFDRSVDAWFLDGFAPGRNPDMWRDEVFAALARLSGPATTATTFTVAGQVRRGLQAAGFSVQKIPGFASKREMLRADFTGEAGARPSSAPWFQAPPAAPAGSRVLVQGAGIAGVTVAAELISRGHAVQLVDAGPAPASGASGNPAGVLLPRLSADMSAAGCFYLSAFLFALWRLQQLQRQQPSLPWYPGGVELRLAPSRRQALLDLGLPESVVRAAGEALLYPQAGWMQPAGVCQGLLDLAAARGPGSLHCHWRTRIDSVSRVDGGWRASTGAGPLQADLLVLAGGWELQQHPLLAENGLRPSRGQISLLQGEGLPAHPVCGRHYLTPVGDGRFCTGATYDTDIADLSLRQQDQHHNLHALAELVPAAKVQLLGGRVGVRAGTRDHLPVVGAVADARAWQQDYRDLRHGRDPARYPPARYLPGLYVSAGHGSRGLCSSFLSAALLADLIDGSPAPLSPGLRQALHPGRFLIRGLKRGTLLQ